MKWFLVIAVIAAACWFFRDKLTGVVKSLFNSKATAVTTDKPILPTPAPVAAGTPAG